MHAAGPMILYFALVAASTLAVAPLCRAVIGDTSRVPLLSVSAATGFPVGLLLFSLVARAVTSYALALPLVACLMAGIATWSRSVARPVVWDRRSDALLLGVYAIVFAGLLALRAAWPSLYWDNDLVHAGTEKLFNFSMIQAFLFGRGYPPENLWLAGQPLDYYVLLHALPGLAAWSWRVLTGDPSAGGTLFLVSDVFLLVAGSLALSAWTRVLLTAADAALSSRQANVLSLGLGLGVLASVNAKAVMLALGAAFGGTQVAWFDLEREAAPFTYSQYPFYLLLQGDHHAYQRIFVLQVGLYATFALLLAARRLHWPRVILCAALAAAVLLGHTGSALLDAVVMVPAVAVLATHWWRRKEMARLRVLAANTGAVAAGALLLSLPVLLHGTGQAVTWHWIGTRLASPLWGFIAAQAGPLLLFAAACSAAILARRPPDGPTREWRGRGWLIAFAASIVLLAAVGRPGAAVATACALLVVCFAPRTSASGEDRTPYVALAACTFCLWLFPEFVAVDLANRRADDWLRWNLALRFWLEGHYLVPFAAVVAFAPAASRALGNRRYVTVLGASALLVAGLWSATHVYAALDRKIRTHDVAGLDGTAFLGREYPCDAALAARLRGEPGKVRIGELCGTGETDSRIPVAYGWPGRIAAFSGRPGICGWTRHEEQSTARLPDDSPTGPNVHDRFREYESQLVQVLAAAQRGERSPGSPALLGLLGVTHLVLGDQEQRLFPGVTGVRLAAATGGQVEFAAGPFCALVRLGSGEAGAGR
jgi:uncharacterized membrane protein